MDAIPELGDAPDCAAWRRAKLIDVAASVFTLSGFNATTMDSIARQAGMSKKTVYKLFESKQALFDAVLFDRFFALPILPRTGGNQEQNLIDLILAMADMLLRPDRMALLRMIVADAPTLPELAGAFDRINVERDMNVLERWLETETREKRLRDQDITESAHFLFGMTVAQYMLMGLTGKKAHCSPEQLQQRVERGVRMFLKDMQPLP